MKFGKPLCASRERGTGGTQVRDSVSGGGDDVTRVAAPGSSSGTGLTIHDNVVCTSSNLDTLDLSDPRPVAALSQTRPCVHALMAFMYVCSLE